MLADRIEGKWIDAFCEVFARCAVKPGDTAAILSETQSRQLNVQLAERIAPGCALRADANSTGNPQPPRRPNSLRSWADFPNMLAQRD